MLFNSPALISIDVPVIIETEAFTKKKNRWTERIDVQEKAQSRAA